ncbi:hypothetical protein MDAP_002299 [Mitosporidium daphniae]|uniref:NadR/Ttd14 AAA domain-containing protein n=1 Tax=Mitosporidium daphniae TaxID=1485682 RepID=A0A098VPS3_9MICR|nr:uncharacterized protein DI09_46p70 [Mitosporidium daphniae]KGG51057.1 hypothetical protein DI09_46p70 [Mitosporidium daphniae]|eukprot:XP_013237503.1 uncharacterized protein DI09_46p70 [Mitosporidium daphniae]
MSDNGITGASPQGRIVKICLTGGPCGGKTSIQVALCDMFENLGWKVFRVPETATILLGAGVSWYDLTGEEAKLFQMHLLKVMLNIEDTFTSVASSMIKRGLNVLILCDRGTMDPGAYIPRPEWISILSELNMDELLLRDQRYDLVLHLMTSAIGAEKFYTMATNEARYESLENARDVDRALANAWVGHPNYALIDNSTDFETKKLRAFEAILTRVGLSDTRFGKGIVKKKYLLMPSAATSVDKGLAIKTPASYASIDEAVVFPAEISFRDFDVRHDYLISTDDSTTRIRRRGFSSSSSYSITQQKTVNGERVEVRRILSPKEYELFLSQTDPSHCPIIKKRRCFLWKERYYQIDLFESPNPGLLLLEAYVVPSPNCTTDSEKKDLPPFLNVSKDITGEKAYSMFHLSSI